MDQQVLNNQQKLSLIDFKIKISNQTRWVEKIIPLKNRLVFFYFENGFYELQDTKEQKYILQGKLPKGIKFFLEIYTKVLLFHDPIDLKIKLLDLNSNQINPKFAFRSSDRVNTQSDKETREIFIDKFRLFFIDNYKKQIKYLIDQDLEKHYSNNNVCHFKIRILPLYYHFESNFDLEPVVRYDYPNSIMQTDLFKWQIDDETIAVYGQDNEGNKSEILLIKPHLMEQAFYIIHTQFRCSYTIMNVTNWVNPHQVAIWVNCNDGTTRPSIFTIDLRTYYDGQNWLPDLIFQETLVSDEYINDEPAIFMDIYQFNLGSTHAIQIRQVGNEAMISVINYQNVKQPEIVDEVIIHSFFIESDVDNSYILLYNELNIENETVKFQILSFNLEKHQLLKVFEETKLIEKYGIHIIEELFEFYQ